MKFRLFIKDQEGNTGVSSETYETYLDAEAAAAEARDGEGYMGDVPIDEVTVIED